MNRMRTGGWAALLLLAALAPAAAQQPPAAPPAAGQTPSTSVFGESIEVRVVNVEAVVTDRQGNRVPDLKPQDFRLKVDGRAVPIEYFNEVRGGSAIALGDAGSSTVKGLPSLTAGSPVGTSYLVFVDDFFSLSPRRNMVLRALKDQLSRLGPDDRMAIVAFNGGVTMLSSWSNSPRQLGAAIEQAIGRPTQGISRLAELRSFESSRRLSTASGFGDSRQAFAQRMDLDELGFANQVAAEVERAVAAASSTLRGFAAPPGRKVMLLLSGGWPFSPADYVLNNPNRPVLEREIPRGDEILRPLADAANRLGYTIYPLDVPGVESGGLADATLGGPSPTGLNVREQEHEASLLWIAQQTGGKALLNSVSDKALETVEGDTRSYYWLGFTPSWQGNDQRHKVEVEVARPGLKVRSREDFFDLSRKGEVSMQVESAMLFGNGPDAVPLPMQVGQPVSTGRKEMEVPVTLAIPVDAVTFVPLNGKYTAELELRVVAVDGTGGRAPVPVIPVVLTSEQQPKAGGAVRYETRIKLRKVAHHLTVAVFDPLSGKILTAQTDVGTPQK